MKLHGYLHGRSAFTLVEMLVVLVIMAILSVLAAPAISSLLSGKNATRNISELSDTLELARQYATANNTYVWVAFYPNTGSDNTHSLSVAVLASNDGTDPESTTSTPWGTTGCNYGTVPSSEISLVSKVTTLKQISLQNAGSFSVDTLPATPTVTASVNSLVTSSSGLFNMALPGASTPVEFTEGVEFLPSGQVRNSSSPINVIDLDVQPQTGSASQTQNVAVLRINGLTGQTVVYRP
jgi:prepilin-type N-terminal cleavage/methylation domain-containing protein